MLQDIRRLLQWLSVPGRSVDVDLHINGILVQVEAITGDNEAQLNCVYTHREDTTVGPVRILTGPQTAPAASLQSAAFCQSEMTALSQVMNHTYNIRLY